MTGAFARTPEADERPPIVALVCSAGGLEALAPTLGSLPADFPAAVIVLQHQSPDRRSRLPEILARRCALPAGLAMNAKRLCAREREPLVAFELQGG